MADEVAEATMEPEGTEPTPVDLEAQKTDLLAKLQEAMNKGEFNEVAKYSREIAKLDSSVKKAEVEAKQAALAGLTEKVRAILDGVVQKLVDKGELEGADGVWYSKDFSGEGVSGCKLLKVSPRKAGPGSRGDTSKKFDVKTEDLLTEFGDQVIPEGGKLSAYAGQTFKEAYEAKTDGNHRYAVRTALLAVGGYV